MAPESRKITKNLFMVFFHISMLKFFLLLKLITKDAKEMYTHKCEVREQPNKRGLEFVVKVQNTEILFKKFSRFHNNVCIYLTL